MTETQTATWNDWIGADVVDPEEKKIGSLENLYLDDNTGQPQWLGVKTGLFGMKETLVPVAGVAANGDSLQVAYAKDLVKDAPNVDPDNGELDRDDEVALARFYNLTAAGSAEGETAVIDAQDTGTDVSGPETDEAMTRSEEELRVGTRQTEAGRARLRKHVVTEQVEMSVPVRKEVLRIEREPVTDANRGAANDGPDISDEVHEIVLNEEEVVVDKQVVAKERVRVSKDVEVEERQVSDEVRKEQIDVEQDER